MIVDAGTAIHAAGIDGAPPTNGNISVVGRSFLALTGNATYDGTFSGYGLWAHNELSISNSTITAAANYIAVAGYSLNISDSSNVTATLPTHTDNFAAMYSNTDIEIDDSTVEATAQSGSTAGLLAHSGFVGITSGSDVTVLGDTSYGLYGTTDVTIADSSTADVAAKAAIMAQTGNITIDSGSVAATSSTYTSLTAGQNVTISGGTTVAQQGINAAKVVITGGSLDVAEADVSVQPVNASDVPVYRYDIALSGAGAAVAAGDISYAPSYYGFADMETDAAAKTYPWFPNVTVTYNGNGGTDRGSVSLRRNTSVGSLPTDPTRSGYTFAGWNMQQGGSGAAFLATTNITSDITVYAQWTANSGSSTGSGSTTTAPSTGDPNDGAMFGYGALALLSAAFMLGLLLKRRAALNG